MPAPPRFAVLVAESDPNGAYQLLYDAARKAIAAHMLASGLRLKSRPGAHETAGRYAQLRIADPAARVAVAQFDRIRRNRNRSEYELVSFSRLEVVTDLAHAEAIVAAVERALSGSSGA